MRKLLALVLCAAELLLFAGRGGLRANYREVEELLVIQTMGLDESGSGVKLSLAAAGDGEDKVARMEADGISISAAMERLRSSSYEEELFCPHIGRLLLGEKLCENGIVFDGDLVHGDGRVHVLPAAAFERQQLGGFRAVCLSQGLDEADLAIVRAQRVVASMDHKQRDVRKRAVCGFLFHKVDGRIARDCL